MSTTASASEGEIAHAKALASSIAHRYGIYLGQGRNGAVFAPQELGALVLGPPRSGKTSGIMVPNVLASAGSVLAVSTKRDLLDATAHARKRIGPCRLFDPSGTIIPPAGVEIVGWSPLQSAHSWDQAVLTAESLVGAARQGDARGAGAHWIERAGALIASLMHAAALEHASMDEVVRTIHRREPERFLAVLTRHDAALALDLLTGVLATDDREQSGIWSTASGALSAYRTSAALLSARQDAFDATAFVANRETLFITAPADHQQHLAPLVAGLVRDIRSASYHEHRTRAQRGGETKPPVLLVLDELANIAPLHDLPVLIAEGASQGIVTLACLQDLSQARQRWGPAAEGFLSLFGAKVILGGLGDERTLRAVSLLAGDHDVPVYSRTRGGRGRTTPGRGSRTVSTRREQRLPPDAIAQLSRGSALALIGAQPSRLALTPYFAASPWREAVLETDKARQREPLAHSWRHDRLLRQQNALDRER